MTEGPPDEVILRRFVYGITDADGDVDVLEAVESAIERINELEQEQEKLRQRVYELEKQIGQAEDVLEVGVGE